MLELVGDGNNGEEKEDEIFEGMSHCYSLVLDGQLMPSDFYNIQSVVFLSMEKPRSLSRSKLFYDGGGGQSGNLISYKSKPTWIKEPK